MIIVFVAVAAVWFAGVAAMFLSRVLGSRSRQVLRASLAVCGVCSVLLAVTSPAVTTDSTVKKVLLSVMFVGFAILCGAALVMLRRNTVEIPEP
ncbi:hypothetical protein [Nocardia nova]|uniref:hypothetical protein n=1 Tax=Nocardia nova TaxID=37330 RepID=UPI000CEA29FE|nr:hypothetical protein [Nocardia nova]PPI89217.1 hypothetical protein C5E46_34415 [Nocardia nova]